MGSHDNNKIQIHFIMHSTVHTCVFNMAMISPGFIDRFHAKKKIDIGLTSNYCLIDFFAVSLYFLFIHTHLQLNVNLLQGYSRNM